jgi:hypothetical protein
MPPRLPGLAASGRPATMPAAAWPGHGAGAAHVGRSELRGMPASGGARQEGQPQPAPTDQVISRPAEAAVATVAASSAHDYGNVILLASARLRTSRRGPRWFSSGPCEPRLTWRQFPWNGSCREIRPGPPHPLGPDGGRPGRPADTRTLADSLGAEDPRLEHMLSMRAVAAHWGELPPREQEILLMRFRGGMTQA